ncbi:hypothetical protein A2U01_0054842, partial [Trifolium medium]|nr:hypothetical protein [Trifolium medium]
MCMASKWTVNARHVESEPAR